MTQRHPIVNDRTMLITTVTKNRVQFFQDSAIAREAIETLYRVQELHTFLLFGFVIMPNHCHFLVKVPPPETIIMIMNVYKSGLTFNTGIPQIWQKRYHIRLIDHPSAALRYIHLDPMRSGLAASPEEYLWSSASGKWEITPLEYSF